MIDLAIAALSAARDGDLDAHQLIEAALAQLEEGRTGQVGESWSPYSADDASTEPPVRGTVRLLLGDGSELAGCRREPGGLYWGSQRIANSRVTAWREEIT